MKELAEIQELADASGVADVLARVDGMPIHCFRFGSRDRAAPALLVTGGVHGLEQIGTHVAIAFLGSLVTRLTWDDILRSALERVRILVVPLVNPVGMTRGTRANGRGVDLMRNAPPSELGGTPLLGGHRLSPRLPWFMGHAIEAEAAALIGLVERELFATPFAIALDLHSGFGLVDRLWYPYARTREPPPDLARIEALVRLLDTTLPNHVYHVEQTARVYTIRGDLWDYLYDRRRALGDGVLLSLTLEMSWLTPIRGRARTERRHRPLFDFLIGAVAAYRAWLSRTGP